MNPFLFQQKTESATSEGTMNRRLQMTITDMPGIGRTVNQSVGDRCRSLTIRIDKTV